MHSPANLEEEAGLAQRLRALGDPEQPLSFPADQVTAAKVSPESWLPPGVPRPESSPAEKGGGAGGGAA